MNVKMPQKHDNVFYIRKNYTLKSIYDNENEYINYTLSIKLMHSLKEAQQTQRAGARWAIGKGSAGHGQGLSGPQAGVRRARGRGTGGDRGGDAQRRPRGSAGSWPRAAQGGGRVSWLQGMRAAARKRQRARH